MAIKTYEKGCSDALSTNFQAREFDCHGAACCSKTLVDEALVTYLQQIRDHFGVPITVTSGYRCKTHNTSIGGATASRHMAGQAADISVRGVAPAEVARYAESIGILGIGLYETAEDGYFVHIDTRENKTFWYGQAQKLRETFQPEENYTLPLRVLKKGCTGPDVKALQQLLTANGCACTADGIFGVKTAQAVAAYQLFNALAASGTADRQTVAKLMGVASSE